MMNDGKQQSTFLLHNYETFGTHPVLGRFVQFAATRVDSEFNVIDEPEVFYCKPVDDCLPQPGAVLITDIIPQEVWTKGENKAAFTTRTHLPFAVSKICILGYNNVHFGDEVTHDVFYRNFYDPHTWNWQHDSSCWDLLDVMRACYVLCLEGINWPKNDDGLSSFRLEHLAKTNDIEHSNIRDAMVDVYAIIAMVELVKIHQLHLFDYLFTHRNKYELMVLIDVPQMKLLVHASGMFKAWRGNTSRVTPLTWYSENRNAVIMVDLAGDILPLLELDSDTLRKRLYTVKADLDGNAAVPVKLVHVNKCSILAQVNALHPEDTDRPGISHQHCLDNLKILRGNPQACEKVVAIFAETEPSMLLENVGTQPYNSFFSDTDRVTMKIVLEAKPRNLPALDIIFADKWAEELSFNYRARNFPGTLDYAEQQCWLEHRHQVFTPEPLQGYADELRVLAQQYANDKKKVASLEALWQYAEEVARNKKVRTTDSGFLRFTG